MNYINGNISIGAPRSKQRFLNASHICGKCLEFELSQFKIGTWPKFTRNVLIVAGEIVCIPSTCEVCEANNVLTIISNKAGE